MNRRGFLGACGVLLAAPIAALTARFETEPTIAYALEGVWCWETPNGESITALEQIGSKLYVFTRSAVYQVETRNY